MAGSSIPTYGAIRTSHNPFIANSNTYIDYGNTKHRHIIVPFLYILPYLDIQFLCISKGTNNIVSVRCDKVKKLPDK